VHESDGWAAAGQPETPDKKPKNAALSPILHIL
jgi:hypothetical protein